MWKIFPGMFLFYILFCEEGYTKQPPLELERRMEIVCIEYVECIERNRIQGNPLSNYCFSTLLRKYNELTWLEGGPYNTPKCTAHGGYSWYNN